MGGCVMNFKGGLLEDMDAQSAPKFLTFQDDFLTKNKLLDYFHPGLVVNSKGER